MEPADLAEHRPEELHEVAERLCCGTSGEGLGGTPVVRTAERFAETLADTRSRDCAVCAVGIVSRLLSLEAVAREESDRLRRSEPPGSE
ncbi:hypothetical protein [Streptomyces sp. PU_AKi4]|uniref:hypothetical protein n=1 Tax=Streptomyces sp. PU_AKi4 TaxID=2800809 RepID=UPI0035241B8F